MSLPLSSSYGAEGLKSKHEEEKSQQFSKAPQNVDTTNSTAARDYSKAIEWLDKLPPSSCTEW